VTRFAGALFCLVPLFGCGTETATVSIPEPDLLHAEPAVIEAVEAAKSEVRLNPDSSEAWGRLGERYRTEKWLGLATECYRRATELDEDNFRWFHLVGKSTWLDDPAAAAGAFERALEIDPDYSPTRVLLARTLIRLGHDDEALHQLEIALEMTPDEPVTSLFLGQLALADGRMQDARNHLTRALRLDPDLGQAHAAMAQVDLSLGDQAAADRHSRQARRRLRPISVADPRGHNEVEPVSSWALGRRGRQLLTGGRVAEAETVLRRAVLADPEGGTLHITLGLALAMQGKLVEAESSLRRAVELEPERGESHAALGKLFFARGRGEDGLESYRAAVRLEPNNVEFCLGLGEALATHGSLEEAESLLSRAIDLDPSSARLRYRLASTQARRGRLVQSDEQLRIAMELQDQELHALREELGGRTTPELRKTIRLAATIHLERGRLLSAMARPNEAVEEIRRSLQIEPGWPEAEQALSRIGTDRIVPRSPGQRD